MRTEFLVRSLAFVVASALAACGGAASRGALGPGVPAGDGHLVLVGGGKKPDDVLKKFVELAGGKSGRIVVLPTASGDYRDTGAYYIELLKKHGAGTVEVVHIEDRRDSHRARYVRRIEQATGVWLSGGDQRRIARRIVGTPLHDALRRMFEGGGVVGGTSAGTACQSEIMLTGDGNPKSPRRGAVGVDRGLGLLRGVVIDQHFLQRKRQARLLSVLLDYPGVPGIGVDEDTAAWIKPNGTVEVLGESKVVFYVPRGDSYETYTLSVGGQFDLRSLAVVKTGAPVKTAADSP